MLTVRVRRATELAALSTALVAAAAGASATGCALEVGDDPELATSEENALIAGSATLELTYSATTSAELALDVKQSSTDEFVRVGENLKLDLPGWLLWQRLYPNDWNTPNADRLKKLEATVKVLFKRGGETVGSKTVKTKATWTGDSYYNLVAPTKSFVVPGDVDALAFDVTVYDQADASKSVHLDPSVIHGVQVFGGEDDLRHALFDNDGGKLRARVVEGDPMVAGSKVVVSYTDWRANTLVDSYGINREIGRATGNGRFGSYVTPIYGDLVNEVAVGYAFDDGQGWRAETTLAREEHSRLLPEGRVSHETTLALPANARKVSAYFHVRTYLIVDYTKFGSVNERWYEQGAKVLVRERWDNPEGTYSNYEYPIEAP